MRPRKYAIGRVLSVGAAISEMTAGRYVMLFNRPMHPGWGLSMQTRTLAGFCAQGSVRAAKITPEWKRNNP